MAELLASHGSGWSAMFDTLGGRLSLAREALGISVAEAAVALNVQPETWTQWESDRCAPPARLLEGVAQCLQVTLWWLLAGRGKGPSWQDLTDNWRLTYLQPQTTKAIVARD